MTWTQIDWFDAIPPPLQLGHGDEAVDDMGINVDWSVHIMLQLGHGDEAVDDVAALGQ